jgi:hypothetical protein
MKNLWNKYFTIQLIQKTFVILMLTLQMLADIMQAKIISILIDGVILWLWIYIMRMYLGLTRPSGEPTILDVNLG